LLFSCLAVSSELLQSLLAGGALEGASEGPLSTIVSGLREVVTDEEEGKSLL
jgi:hypothetical protein